MPHGLDTQLGPTWHDGVELSIGQWQKLALARGFMRDEPLLCVLDEPTAALDAETEHALFERFAAASREASDDGRVTVLVSHRFSTVRMADQIVVLDGAQRGRGRRARRADGPGAGSTPSSTRCRRAPTGRSHIGGESAITAMISSP